MVEHSRLFSPSGATRWINCSASAEASTRFEDEPGEAAQEGTAWHFLGESCLTQGVEPEAFLGRTITVREGKVERKFVVSREFVADARLSLDFKRELIASGGEVHAEADIDLSHLHPDCRGRCDLWHLSLDGVLTVLDDK